MSDRIEGYLADLDGRLSRHLEAGRRAELVVEVRSHLTLAAKATSEAEALQAFGPVRSVAEDLIRREKGLDTKPAWRLAWLPILVMTAAVILQGLYWLVGSVSVFEASAWMSKLFLITFVWAVWRTRRWLASTVLMPLILATVLSVAIDATFAAREAARTRPEMLRSYEHWVRESGARLASYERAMGGDLSAVRTEKGYTAPVNVPTTMSYEIPLMPFSISRSIADVAGAEVENASDARERWRQDGAALVAKERALLDEYRNGYENLVSNQVGFKLSTDMVVRLGAMWLAQACLLFLLNGTVLGIAKLGRARRRRRDPHLA